MELYGDVIVTMLGRLFGIRADSGDGGGQPAPDDDFWYGDAPAGSMAGPHVSPDTAIRIATVYACVRLIAETMAQLPLILYRRTDDGGKIRANDHPLYKLLHDQPNAWQTSYRWREQAQLHIGLRGNAYSRIIEDRRGQITALVPVLPDRVTPEQLPSGRIRYKIAGDNGQTEFLTQDEILHVRSLSWDGVIGLNPLAAMRENIGLALAQQAYGARFFKNDAAPRGTITMPGRFKDAEHARETRKQFRRETGGAKQHSLMLLDQGMEFKPIGMSMLDAQFLEQRKYQDVQIAAMWRVPPHKVGILDRATFSNIESQGIDFAQYSMMSHIRRLETDLNISLLTESERDEMFFEINFDGLLRGATLPRYQANQSAIIAGWMTRNEVRKRENMPPKEGLDEPLEPLNMAPAGEARDGGATDDAGGDREPGGN